MKLAVNAVASMLFGVLFFGLGVFLPAWTFDYWQAWVFIAVFIVATMIPNFYLAVKDPATLQRRLKAGPTAETRPLQRIVMTAVPLSVVAMLVLSAVDHRFGWSSVPLPVVILGDVLVVVGLFVAQLVVIQNRHAAATITVEADQELVSTGLYGVVRRLPALFALAARIGDEEKMLSAELAGYGEYTQRVRHRVVPGVW